MSGFEPTRPEGASFHPCENCDGGGLVVIDGEEQDCPECDGTGEWFE